MQDTTPPSSEDPSSHLLQKQGLGLWWALRGKLADLSILGINLPLLLWVLGAQLQPGQARSCQVAVVGYKTAEACCSKLTSSATGKSVS